MLMRAAQTLYRNKYADLDEKSSSQRGSERRATDALSTEERKYSNPNGNIRRLGGRIHLHKKSLLNQIKKVRGSGKQVQQQRGKEERKSRRSREQQTLTRATDAQVSNTLHCHEREELQNNRSTEKEGSTSMRTEHPKAWKNQKEI